MKIEIFGLLFLKKKKKKEKKKKKKEKGKHNCNNALYM